MSLTPYQQSIWLVMCARNVGHLGVAFILIGLLPIMGVRFMEHQILVGGLVGCALFFISDRIIRYVPDPNSSEPGKNEQEPPE